MPNFGDFNFNDDADSVDTDPTPDNVGPELESSSDGIQNDKTNYHEPGEGKQHEGGDFSEFAKSSNPEEPQAQQDEVPPIRIDPEYFYGDPIDDTIDDVVNFLTGKRKYTKKFITGNKTRAIDRLIKEYEKTHPQAPIGIEDADGDKAAPFRMPINNKTWSDNILDAFANRDARERLERDIQRAAELGVDIGELDPEPRTNFEVLRDFFITVNDRSEWPELFLEHYGGPETSAYKAFTGVLDEITNNSQWPATIQQIFAAMRQQDKLTSDNIPDSFAQEILLANGITEDLLDIIVDTDDAESEYNPTGIGEMFDRPIVDGSDDSFSMISILAKTSPTESLPNISDMEGLEGLDFLNLLESTLGLDINDYLGDITQESDLIDFQNMTAGALENFDGLL